MKNNVLSVQALGQESIVTVLHFSQMGKQNKHLKKKKKKKIPTCMRGPNFKSFLWKFSHLHFDTSFSPIPETIN